MVVGCDVLQLYGESRVLQPVKREYSSLFERVPDCDIPSTFRHLHTVIMYSEAQINVFRDLWVNVLWFHAHATGVNGLEERFLALTDVLCRRGGQEDIVGLSRPLQL